MNILKEKAELHPEMLSCIAYIASVKLETFRPYLSDLLNFLMELEEKGFKDELHYLDESWVKLATVMGQEFEPYFLKIFDRVMKTAEQRVETNWEPGMDGVEMFDDGTGFASNLKIEQKKQAIELLIIFMQNFTKQIQFTLSFIYQIGRNAMDCGVSVTGISGVALLIAFGRSYKTLYGEGHEQIMFLFIEIFQKLVTFKDFFSENDVIENLTNVCRKLVFWLIINNNII